MSGKKDTIKHCSNCPSRGSGIFCELDSLMLNEVSEHKITNTFKKGQTLFVEGNPPYGLFCVSKGNIKLSKMSEDGKDSIIRLASGGDVLGHQNLFTDEPYNLTATAMDECFVCFLDKKYIIKLVQEKPSIAANLICKLGKELGASEKKIASFSQKNVRERLVELLLLLRQTHGVEVPGKKWKLEIKITREEMASIIGTATETLIRFVSELKDEGLLEQEGKTLIIPNGQKLANYVNM